MRTLILQHTEEEVPGTLTDWLALRAFPYVRHKMYSGSPIPRADEFDFLVVLGGPMNVDEERKFPWLREEKLYLQNWLKHDKSTLGICLGGQMLAQVLGGRVTKNTTREIGFHEVRRTGHPHPALADWPERLHVFQYHEDRFTLPAGCTSLLTSEITEHQAFALNSRTVGLQFHPESTEAWILEGYEDFVRKGDEPFVQNREECVTLLPKHLAPMTSQFFSFLDKLAKQ